MSGMNIIFYSKECPTCFKLIQLLDSENFIKYFKCICIDGNYDKLPQQIKAVPTMIVNNINRPLQPEECFKWVASMVHFRDNKGKNDKENMDIEGFAELEFGKFSDQFTFVDSTKNDPFAQAFFKYKDEKNNSIHTAPLDKRINSREQNKRIKELELARNQQENKFKLNMKAEQREKLIKHKK